MAGAGSLVVRRQLGARLRQLRIAAGKSMGDVGESGLASKAKLSRLEAGKGPIKIADVWALCRLYGASEETTEALAALAPGTQQEDWWQQDYNQGVVPDWLGLYAGLEASASRLRCYEPELVHGLVQTPEYARGVIATDRSLSEDVVEQRVRFRMQRQRTSTDITVILAEAALHLVVGSADVMAAQLQHLRECAAKILVRPFAAGPSPRRQAFAMLEFTDEADPSVVYIEGAGMSRYFDKPADWAEYELSWRALLETSIPIREWAS
jgi:transcriptional regulator with XRE-family HTH domain